MAEIDQKGVFVKDWSWDDQDLRLHDHKQVRASTSILVLNTGKIYDKLNKEVTHSSCISMNQLAYLGGAHYSFLSLLLQSPFCRPCVSDLVACTECYRELLTRTEDNGIPTTYCRY